MGSCRSQLERKAISCAHREIIERAVPGSTRRSWNKPQNAECGHGRLSRISGEHAPLAAISTTPRAPLRICVRFHRRVFQQHRRSLARRDNSIGSRICLGKIRGFTGTAPGRRNVGLLSGRYLFLLDRAALGPRLERIHWLHLSPESVKWPERFFKRFGAKAVFVARFIPLFPPAIANLFAGMSKMPWPIYLFHNLTGSAVYTASYILLGYFFGKRWKLIEAWLGTTALYLILTGAVFIFLGVIFRHRFGGLLLPGQVHENNGKAAIRTRPVAASAS